MKRRLWDVPLWKQGRKVILAFGLALTMFASACGTSSSETTSEAAQSSAAAAETTAAETTAAAAVEETTTAAASSGLEESVKLLNDYDNPAVYTSPSNQILYHGLYRQEIQVNDVDRELVVYLPEHARKNEYFVTIALPSDADVYSFLEESGWMEIADENNCGIRILLPDGKWGTYEEEAAYINTARNAGGNSFAGFYYTAYGFEYLYGAGDGGALLEQWAAENPMQVISQVFVDTDVSSDSLADQTKDIIYANDMTMPSYPDSEVVGVYESVDAVEVPVPTWLVDSEDSLSYWQQVNDCETEAEKLNVSVDTNVYWQDKEASNAIATSYSDVISQVRVSEEAEYSDEKFAEDVYDFFSKYTRAVGDSVYSNVLGKRLDYKEAKADGRLFEVFDYVQTVDNTGNENATTPSTDWERNYIVYVPEQCKDYSETSYPVVYFFSGGSTPSHAYLDQTHAWEIADKYGFIAVVPSSVNGWNLQDGSWPETIDPETGSISDDVAFVNQLFTTIEQDFNVDTGRVYITGLSMGGIFCNYLGMQLGDRITAVGLTSGPIFGSETYDKDYSVGTGLMYQEGATTNTLPTMVVMGERDNWPIYVGEWNFDLTDKWYAGQMNSNNPNRYNDAYYSAATQDYWLSRNGLELDAYEIVEEGLTLNGQDVDPVEYNKETAAKRYTTYQWNGSDDIPLFSWVQCAGRAHSTVVSDYEKVWTDWFSHFRTQKSESGSTSYYSASGFEKDDAVELK